MKDTIKFPTRYQDIEAKISDAELLIKTAYDYFYLHTVREECEFLNQLRSSDKFKDFNHVFIEALCYTLVDRKEYNPVDLLTAGDFLRELKLKYQDYEIMWMEEQTIPVRYPIPVEEWQGKIARGETDDMSEKEFDTAQKAVLNMERDL